MSVATGFLAAVVFLTALWAMQRRLIYFPSGEEPSPAAAGLSQVDPVVIRTEDGLDLGAWFVPADGAPRAAVLVLSGNAGHRGYRAPLASALRRHGLQVLLTDYRGFGGNPGTPTEQGLAADARAARAYLAGRAGVDPSRLVYFGESLGAAVAVRLAAEHAPAGLVLRSPFTSMTDVGRYHYPILPVRWLLRDRYDAMAQIAEVRAPTLVVAGDEDGIVPFEHSRRVFDAAPEPKQLVVVPGADHNDDELLAGPALVQAVADFVARFVAARPTTGDAGGPGAGS